MGKIDSFTKVAFTGNTQLTLDCIQSTMKTREVVAVFGLSDNELASKTNSLSLDSFCQENNIKLFKSNDWREYSDYCKQSGVELVITIGDSRIIPKVILDKFYTIGNHGAVLPDVSGGASLVWGRLLDSGSWGISIMKIEENIDSGEILKTKEFWYEDEISESKFCKLCDRMTVAALDEVLGGDYTITKNKKYDVRISKHTDSEKAVDILRQCLYNGLSVYMPPRTPDDSLINPSWSEKFKSIFRVAQNTPYPKYIESRNT